LNPEKEISRVRHVLAEAQTFGDDGFALNQHAVESAGLESMLAEKFQRLDAR
jgi:hypothetical protein